MGRGETRSVAASGGEKVEPISVNDRTAQPTSWK